MASIAEINVKVGADIKQMQKGLKKATRTLRQQSRKWGEFGSAMTAAVSIPVAGFLGRSVQLFDKQAQAIAQVNAGLKSTGGAAGFTSDQLQKMAGGLQEISTFGDEDILQNVTSQLLTFTNVANEQFPKAQQAILDLSARLGTDLKNSALQVGKALNDPVKGITALSRSGIQFSKDQKALIKSLSETGRMAEAQTIILKELENQFGGSAEAAAKAGLGPIRQFNNSLGDMMETIGGAILPQLTDLVKGLTSVFKRFDNLSDSTKQNVIQFSLFAAAIGPVSLGISKAISIYSTLKSATVALSIATKTFSFSFAGLNAVMRANPIGFVIGAIATLATGFTIAYKKSQTFRAVIAGLINTFWEFGSIIKDTFGNLISGFGNLVDGNFKDAAKNFSSAFFQLNPITGFAVAGQRLASAYSKGFQDKIADEAAAMQEEAVKAIVIPVAKVNTPTASISSGGGSKKQVNPIREQIPALAELSNVTTGLVTSITAGGEAWKGFGEHMEMVKERVAALKEQLTPMQSIMSALGDEMASSFDRGIKSLKDFARAALDAIGKVIGAIIKKGVASAIANVLGSSPLGLFLAPAAGAAASALFRGVINKIKPPALAKGGLAYGPTTAIVGDNIGARSNPEVIAPLDKLQKIIGNSGGGGKERLVAQIKGDDLILLLERATNRRKRMGVI